MKENKMCLLINKAVKVFTSKSSLALIGKLFCMSIYGNSAFQ